MRSSGRALSVWGCLILFTPITAQEIQTKGPISGQPLSVEELPFRSLGAADGDPAEEFFRVTSPFLLPDGGIVVPLPRFGEVRVFDSHGTLTTTLGRLGEGPGEFRGLISAWPRGDTIETFDGRLRRVTRFYPDGSMETISINAEGAGYRPDSAIPGVFHGGWALMGVSGGGYGYRDEIMVGHFGREGELVDTIAQVEGISRYKAPGMTGPTPLSPSVSFAILNDVLYVGETLTASVGVVSPSGKVTDKVTWNPEEISPREAIRKVVSLAVERAEAGERPRVRERLEAAPVPRKVPYFSAFRVDALGFVWVRPYE
ncbi:MAG: hypothetical protein KJN92_02775, partial [Gemmatimonadetes bacterium]|nr:hypothetical protein [Gemmatimonadota bacterium]